MADLFLAVNPFYISLGQIYLQYALFIDSLIALILFVSLANWIFGKKYGKEHDGHKVPSKESKLIAVGVGLALTVAFAVFELRTGFTFAQLAPVAVLVLLALLAVFLYEFLLASFGEDKKACAAAFVYLIIYGLFISVKSQQTSILLQQYRFVWGLLALGFVIAFIKFLKCIFDMFSGGGHGHGDAHNGEHGEEHGDHGGAHDEKHDVPQLPLTVQLYRPLPHAHFHVGESIEVAGFIQGGAGSYAWQLQGNFNQNNIQPFRGTGSTITAHIVGLPAGDYKLIAEAVDGQNKVQTQTDFKVEAGHDGHGDGHGPDTHGDGHGAPSHGGSSTPHGGPVPGPANPGGAGHGAGAHGNDPHGSAGGANGTSYKQYLAQIVPLQQALMTQRTVLEETLKQLLAISQQSPTSNAEVSELLGKVFALQSSTEKQFTEVAKPLIAIKLLLPQVTGAADYKSIAKTDAHVLGKALHDVLDTVKWLHEKQIFLQKILINVQTQRKRS